MKTYSYRAFLTLSLFFISFLSFADPLDPPPDDDPSPTPINSKLIWLGVLGILFAFFIF